MVLFLLISCSKDENQEVANTPISAVSKYTLVETEATPGDIVEIKSEQKIIEQAINLTLNNSSVNAYAVGDYSYKFIVPVINSGNYDIKLPNVDKNSILTIKIDTYTSITKPEEIIDGFILKRDRCFEEMKKIGSSQEILTLIDQIKQEWDFQYSKSSAEDKKLLAYMLQKNNINPEWFNSTKPFPDSYYSKLNNSTTDIGDALVTEAKVFASINVICVSSIAATVATAGIFAKWTNGYTALAFVASFSTYLITRDLLIKKGLEVASLKGFAESISDVFTQKTASLELVNNIENDISITMGFRNLNGADRNIQADITNAFNAESEMTVEDSKIKNLYENAIKFTEKLKGLYPSYISVIGNKPQRKMNLTVLDKDIIIKGSSDPKISISTSLVGDVRKIKATSESKEDLNFYLKIGYKRTIDGKELTKDISYTFKAIKPIDSLPIYKAAVVGNWTMTWHDPSSASQNQIDKFALNADGTGFRSWTKCSGCTTGEDLLPENPSYRIDWSIRKVSEGVWYLDFKYPDRGWSSSARILLKPIVHLGVPITTGLYYLGVKD